MTGLRVGIVIPTVGDSHERLSLAIRSIKCHTGRDDILILVSDDATPWCRSTKQLQVCDAMGVEYRRSANWGMCWRNFHEAGMAIADRCDVIVFFADDCLASRRWLDPVIHFYEHNPDLKPAMVSPVFVEAWELAINRVIETENSFYENIESTLHGQGILMRDDLNFDRHLYEEAFAEKRVHIAIPSTTLHIGVMGTRPDGTYNMDTPKALVGGSGPCFSIRSDVFREIGGFDRCDFTGDFECMLGFKCWDAGYSCVLVPGPPVYHGRGYASREQDVGDSKTRHPELQHHFQWEQEALAHFASEWPPYRNMLEAHDAYVQRYVHPTNNILSGSSFMPREEWRPK